MEIVLGILLLFGAFTLGAVTSDSTDHDTRAAQIVTDGLGYHTQSTSPLQTCQVSRSAKTYRDLTVPYAQPVDQRRVPASDCEVDCWDD